MGEVDRSAPRPPRRRGPPRARRPGGGDGCARRRSGRAARRSRARSASRKARGRGRSRGHRGARAARRGARGRHTGARSRARASCRAGDAALANLARLAGAPAMRCHGDLHVGQFIASPAGPVVVDFEGEPGRPVASDGGRARRCAISPACSSRSITPPPRPPAGSRSAPRSTRRSRGARRRARGPRTRTARASTARSWASTGRCCAHSRSRRSATR